MDSTTTTRTSPKRIMKTVAALLFVALLCSAVVVGLGPALAQLLMALALAYLFFPVVQRLEARGVRRTLAVVLVVTLVVGIFVGLLVLMAVYLSKEIAAFAEALPRNVGVAIEALQKLSDKFELGLTFDRDDLMGQVKTYASGLSPDIASTAAAYLKEAFSSTTSIMVSILNVYLLPVFFFYIVNDYERIIQGARSLVPRPILASTAGFFVDANGILKAYFRGQVLLCLARAVLYAVGLALLGLDFGLLLGLLTGLVAIIPYVGVSMGLLAAMVIVLATDAGLALAIGVAVVFAVVYVIEEFWLRVKIIEQKSGLGELTIMLVLMVGGNLFGIVGLFVAIPVAGIVKLVLTSIVRRYRSTRYYLGDEEEETPTSLPAANEG